MKPLILFLSLTILTALNSFAQSTRQVTGTVMDSTKLTLPGTTVKLISASGDSLMTIADLNGKFTFQAVKGDKLTITFSSIGYTSLRKHFNLDADTKPVDLGTIILSTESNLLHQVVINGVVPVTLKEDTVQYQASAYKVRDNAPAEDLIKKLPGVDVDVNGNVSTQGKQVTKIRINGKDFMGGDLQAATKTLPADVIENIQMIDDYGDQANLTGVKTGDPDKIMNITIRKDKNYGYTAQGTVADGRDALPSSGGVDNKNRYIGALSLYNFNNNQQVSLLGSINNTNVNTLFANANGGGGGGRGGGGGGGTANRDGITNARSIGLNFRDQWGKSLSVYGSYSFSDNTTSTINTINKQYTNPSNPQLEVNNNTASNERINHRFTWNMEWKPDTVNYLKISPTFSYGGGNSSSAGTDVISNSGTPISTDVSKIFGDNQAPTYGFNALYNHHFHSRANLSLYGSVNTGPSWSYQNQRNEYTGTAPTTPANQIIQTYSRTTSYNGNLSYLNPLGKLSFLELNYSFNHSITTNNKETDIYNPADSVPNTYYKDDQLSTRYNYTFTTNRIGLNYVFREKKYNYTLGVSALPSVLDGTSIGTETTPIRKSIFNITPTARFIYNFSRSKSFSANYNGSSSAPDFTQLVPVRDYSDVNNPTQGNPDLKPSFTNNVGIRYNNFSFETGNVLFTNFSYQQVKNQVVTNVISASSNNNNIPASSITRLTQYLNADGYYTVSGRFTFAKPWATRKYTLSFNGSASYTNNVGYYTTVNGDPLTATQQEIDAARIKNIAKSLAVNPGLSFRVDIANVIDAQLSSNYSITKTNNSVNNNLTTGASNVRAWVVGLNGKNYFGDWTFSYDYSKTSNYGYSSDFKVTNPNILNVYLERMFLKNKVATIRIAAYDLFNQNTGYSVTQQPNYIQQTSVNRLSRYYLLSFTLRLKKFAGKAPAADPGLDGPRGPGGRGDRGGDGGGRGNGGGGGNRGGGGFGGGGF